MLNSIDKIETYTGSILIENENGEDIMVASLSANVNLSTLGFSININPYDTEAILKEGATNAAGQTVEEQYENFETAVKAEAKTAGFIFFK